MGKGWGWLRKSTTEGGGATTGHTCKMTYFNVSWTFLAELAEIFRVMIINMSWMAAVDGGLIPVE